MIKLKHIMNEASQKITYDNMSGYVFVNDVAFSKHDIVEISDFFRSKPKFSFPTKQFNVKPTLKIHDKINGGTVIIDNKLSAELTKYAGKIGWDKITGRD